MKYLNIAFKKKFKTKNNITKKKNKTKIKTIILQKQYYKNNITKRKTTYKTN